MELPELIASLFDDAVTGVLQPVLKGLYALAPWVFMIGAIVCVALIVFSPRPGKIGGIVGLVVMAFIWPNLPDLMSALMGYTGGSLDMGAAMDAAGAASAAEAAPSLSEMG